MTGPATRPTPAHAPSDRGSVLVLALGVVVIGMLAVVIGVDASAAFLQRRSLVALADASALAGAQGIDVEGYQREGMSAASTLDPATVSARVRGFLAGADPIEGLRIERLASDGRTVIVRLRAPIRVPFLSVLVGESIVVESRARLAHRPGAPDPYP